MGLLDRIQDDMVRELTELGNQELEAQRVRQEHEEALHGIIEDWLQKLANNLQEEFKVVRAGRYYQIGDIVLSVQLFQYGTRDLPDLGRPQLVAMEYQVKIMGVRTERDELTGLNVGTLQFVTYDSLYRAIKEAPGYLDLHASEVLRLLLGPSSMRQ